jgi:hypothetical protein
LQLVNDIQITKSKKSDKSRMIKKLYFWHDLKSAKVMKNLPLTGLAILFLATTAFGQSDTNSNVASTTSGGKLRMGLSAAPVFSWFSPEGEGNAIEANGSRFSIKYGLYMDFKLSGNENYFFSTGLFMINSGGSLSQNNAVQLPNAGSSDPLYLTRREVDYRINYLTIPLNFKLMTNEIGYNRYFARVGFDASLAVSSRFDSEDILLSDPGSPLSRDNADSGDLTRFYRFGLHVEGGLEYNIGGNANLMVSLEWNNGLNNVFSKDNRLPTGTDADNNVQLNGERATATINFLTLNLGVYF